MIENTLYDKKSLRAILGKNADFKEIAKDCIGFANAQGGIIDIGIEDDSEQPPLHQIIPADLQVRLLTQIAGKTINVHVSAETLTADNGGQYIHLIIHRNAHSLASTSDGRYYLRIGDTSKPVTGDDFLRLAADKDSIGWEGRATQWTWNKCDKMKLSDLLNRIKESERVTGFIKDKETKEILDYYGLTMDDSDFMTNLGVLFIGTRQQRSYIPCSPIVQCIKYDMYGEKIQKYLWDDYSLSPLELIDTVWERIPDWREITEITDGMMRRSIIAYSDKLVRELICNSLVHRAYTVHGDIFINIHPDYVEFVNPGQLPLGVTESNILHKSVKRNEKMANLLYALKYMEREGSGYDKMYEVQLVNGKQVPRVIEGDDSVTVIVERRIVNQEAIKVMQTASKNFPLKQKQIICLGMIAQAESLSGSDLIRRLELKNNVELRPWLRPLLDMGLVETNEGKTRGVEYHVAPSLLKNSNFKGRTTLKRIEQHRLRELILEDVRIYGPTSISDINVRIGEEINRRSLIRAINNLVEEALVVKVGKGRALKYVKS